MFKKYGYILLFAIAFLCVFVVPAIASQSPQATTSTDQNIPSWLVGGGGVGCAGLGVVAKAKLDEIAGKAKTTATGLSSSLEDYTNSPQYLKEKLKILNQEIQKTNDNCDRLIRRFSFTERQLIRRIEGYQSYEDHKNKSTYN